MNAAAARAQGRVLVLKQTAHRKLGLNAAGINGTVRLYRNLRAVVLMA